MATDWESTFRERMRKFGINHPAKPDDVSVSIKIRVTSGCFHREHSPSAYKIIDEFLQQVIPDEQNFAFEEHENGPEILVYVALTTSLVSLTVSVVDLVTTIIKARSESAKKGDHPQAPIELIVRREIKSGEILEEKVLRIGYDEPIDPKEIEKKLNHTTQKLLSKGKKQHRKK